MSILLMILVIVAPLKVESLRCNEGINVTLFGLPFYHWKERECFGVSSCFTQEISLVLDIPVSMRYGGCISKYYAKQFNCKKLFGNNSNFNPSTLLNLVTDSDDFVEGMAEDFRQNKAKYFHQLFSKGMGTNEFIEGIFSLNEEIGLNMTEARKLKQPLTDYLSAFLYLPMEDKDVTKYLKEVKEKETNLLRAIGNLNTNHSDSADKMYSFFRGTSHRLFNSIKASEFRRTLENMPGLARSMISKEDDQALKWFDGIVRGLGKVNALNLTKSALDMADEIAKSVTMPSYAHQIIKYVFNSVFQCLNDMVTSAMPGSHTSPSPCINALLTFGNPDNYTMALTSKITAIFTAMIDSPNAARLQHIKEISNFLQTLFRTFVPIPASEMNAGYQVLIDGLGSFNFANFSQSKQLDRTKLSEFIIELLRRTNPDISAPIETTIINLSKAFYNVMTSKYATDLDIFFTTLISGFTQFPKVNSGTILKDLLENFGQKIPLGLQPVVDNLQPIIDSLTHQGNSRERMNKTIDRFQDLTRAYQEIFPTSKFPSIAMRYLTYTENMLPKLEAIHATVSFSKCDPASGVQSYSECIQGVFMKRTFEFLKLQKQITSIDIDLFFVVLEATGFTSDSFIEKALARNQTALAAYARLLRSLDPEDIKELKADYDMWMINLFQVSDNYNFDNFILAVNYTTSKITSKLAKVMKGLRYVHAPETCRHVTCEVNVCNTHHLINGIPVMTKSKLRGEIPELSKGLTTTPTGCAVDMKSTIHFSIILVLVASMNAMGL